MRQSNKSAINVIEDFEDDFGAPSSGVLGPHGLLHNANQVSSLFQASPALAAGSLKMISFLLKKTDTDLDDIDDLLFLFSKGYRPR